MKPGFCKARTISTAAISSLVVLLLLLVAAPASAGPLWTANGVEINHSTSSTQPFQQAVADGSGGAVIVWQDYRTGTGEIYAQRINALGQVRWGANGVLVSTGLYGRTDPQVIATGTGYYIVTWSDERGLYEQIYAQKLDGNGTRQWENGGGSGDYNGIPVCSNSSNMTFPVLASDAAGGAIIAWTDSRGGVPSQLEVYAQHVLSGGTLDVPSWPAAGLAIATGTWHQQFPRIVPDTSGGAVITWEDGRRTVWPDPVYEDVYAQKVTGAGAVQWVANGVPVNIDQYSGIGSPDPVLSPDGSGGAVITWEDYRLWPGSTLTKVYAQRMPSSGVRSWAENGIPVSNGAGNQGGQKIAADEGGGGGAVITWEDGRGPATNIYAQSMALSGSARWGVGGVPAYSTSSPQYGGFPVSDGSGGSVIAWMEYRDGSPTTHVYAQRLNSGGAAQWGSSGSTVCDAAGGQGNPVLVRDADDGGIVVWEDGRAGNKDVYAQRVIDSPIPQTVSPSKGNRGSSVSATIGGKYLEAGATVKLKKTGQSDITATGVSVPSSTRIVCTFPLPSSATVGVWDVFVQNPDAPNPQSGTLASAFTIEYPPPSITSIDPSSTRVGWTVNVQDLKGTGFHTGATVKLKKAGQADISATDVSVVSTTKITCSFDFTGKAAGAWDLYVMNTDGKSVTKSGVFTLYPAATTSWYLAEGSTAWGFDDYITIANPNSAVVTAYITYMTDTGPKSPPSLNLPANSQTTVNPRDFLGNRDFSTQVTTGSASLAVDRTMSWMGGGAAEKSAAHNSIGVTSPASTWYLPEGTSNWGFETWLCVQNPNRAQAQVTITYMVEGGSTITKTRTVPGFSRGSYSMVSDIGNKDASIKVTSDMNVIAERSVYRNSRGEGHCSVGTTTAAADYYLAEGTSAWGFTTYVLVQNPNSSSAAVTVTYMTASGARVQPSFDLAANARKTIRVNDALPNTDFSTRVHADRNIIAERSMYWSGPPGESCHDSIGTSAAHTRFYLPDGQTSLGHETWTLVQNPNSSAVTVEITYMTPSGTGNVTFDDSVPANSRKSYSMGDRVADGRAAVMVRSKTNDKNIIVERAMYWDNRSCGTDTIGGYEDI